jgi:hypothetical protein
MIATFAEVICERLLNKDANDFNEVLMVICSFQLTSGKCSEDLCLNHLQRSYSMILGFRKPLFVPT